MTARIEIISPGLQSSIQDRGRFGFQEFGVPRSGTVVPHWMALGNSLLGNHDDAVGMEFRLMGPTFRVIKGSVKIVVCGDVQSIVKTEGSSASESQHFPGWQSLTLEPGSEVSVGALKASAAGFIAFAGGLDITAAMGSCSTYARSKIGGDVLKKGDQFQLGLQSSALAQLPEKIVPQPPAQDISSPVRIVPGPQDDYFSAATFNKLLDNEYSVSNVSDRMGARLEGPTLEHLVGMPNEIASDGIVPGAIQIPGNGQPIVLLNDGQTVGGYPKIATVISSDIHRIANALAGSMLRFEQVTADEACQIARNAHKELERLKQSVTTFAPQGFVDVHQLYSSNLISGAVDSTNPDHFPGHLENDSEMKP